MENLENCYLIKTFWIFMRHSLICLLMSMVKMIL
jgi:uncharacterized membrane protein